MREPRASELELLQLLLNGPTVLNHGPVGRALKRGWCRIVSQYPSTPLYQLTELGRQEIEKHRQDSAHRRLSPAPAMDESDVLFIVMGERENETVHFVSPSASAALSEYYDTKSAGLYPIIMTERKSKRVRSAITVDLLKSLASEA